MTARSPSTNTTSRARSVPTVIQHTVIRPCVPTDKNALPVSPTPCWCAPCTIPDRVLAHRRGWTGDAPDDDWPIGLEFDAAMRSAMIDATRPRPCLFPCRNLIRYCVGSRITKSYSGMLMISWNSACKPGPRAPAKPKRKSGPGCLDIAPPAKELYNAGS
nr:hypothetical protein CFP56_12365 [Quercus suber]